jgi:hypothetical protein
LLCVSSVVVVAEIMSRGGRRGEPYLRSSSATITHYSLSLCLLSLGAEDTNGAVGAEINQEDVIRRMKVLSKAQTTFLKVDHLLTS